MPWSVIVDLIQKIVIFYYIIHIFDKKKPTKEINKLVDHKTLSQSQDQGDLR